MATILPRPQCVNRVVIPVIIESCIACHCWIHCKMFGTRNNNKWYNQVIFFFFLIFYVVSLSEFAVLMKLLWISGAESDASVLWYVYDWFLVSIMSVHCFILLYIHTYIQDVIKLWIGLHMATWCQMGCVVVSSSLQCSPMQCQTLGKTFTGPTYKLLLSFMVISDVYRFTLSQIKLYLPSTALLSGFQSSPGALKSTE